MSLFLALALSACGGGGNGYLAPTNQSPTAASTATSTATPTPKPGSAYAYAFARNGQVWLAQAGKSPQQLSQLATTSGQTISALAWSPDGKHLAFELSGVGNPVDYVIDASTGDFSALNLPSTTAAAQLGWANNTTVIGAKQVSGNTQFWKTDISTGTASQLTQVTGTPQVQIVGGGIFYSERDSSTNQIMLHRYDVGAGSEGTPVAITPAGTSTLKVNWDVSPDGSHVLTGFRLPTPDSSWDNGFWSINFSDNTDRSPVFTNDELPFSNFKDTDTVTLSYSPDGQTVLIDTNGTVGPVTEGLDDSNFTTYSPHVNVTSPGQISWAPNGASFVINGTGSANQATIYTVASKSAGKTFADKATLLQWAPTS
ncbi:MAG TPA: hypothetical protein VKT82_18490 [Ktedonobacterales bacterium]|nr:hypothetical protein [Ktedonobacterales bacterium]